MLVILDGTDGVDAPVPGFLVGGPNPGQQDKAGCPVSYASAAPALSYLDHFCSYASNEIAINWNAPLTYALASFLDAYTGPTTTSDAAIAPADASGGAGGSAGKGGR